MRAMVAGILFLLVLFLLGGISILMVKRWDQKQHDGNRKTYRLSFPRDLDEQRVAAWIRSISGTLRPSSLALGGAPTVAFELWATSQGLSHRLKVPWQHADYVIGQLRSLVPGIRVTPEDEWPHRQWTKAVEVGLKGSHRPLRIMSALDMATSLLSSVQSLGKGEAVIIQWVMTPAIPTHPPIHREATTAEFGLHHLWHGSE